MAFTQLMTVEGADEAALHDHLADWHATQAGVAPGYLGARLLADPGQGSHVIVVDFSSEEDARRNNDRPETAEWADKLRQLGTPAYRDLRQVYTTY